METAIVSLKTCLAAWLEGESELCSLLMEERVTRRQMVHLGAAAACLAVPFLSSSLPAIALALLTAAALMKSYLHTYEQKGGEA